MAALRDLARQLIDGETIYTASRGYSLRDVVSTDAKFRATILSDGFVYVNSELAESKEDAVYKALCGLHLMGRFCMCQLDEPPAKPTKTPQKQLSLQLPEPISKPSSKTTAKKTKK